MDVEIFRFINDFAYKNKLIDAIMIFLAEYAVYVIALIMIILWIVNKQKNNRLMLLTAFLAFIFGEILNRVISLFIFHTQPFTTLSNVNVLIEKSVDNSFPSNHATLVFSVMTVFFLYTKNYKGLIALAISLFISISRIYVGVHYPIDVFVGMIIGIMSGVLCFYAFRKVKVFKEILNKLN